MAVGKWVSYFLINFLTTNVTLNSPLVLSLCLHLQDVVTFLSWAAEPEMDDRKLMGAKFISVLMLCLITAVYYKRWKWAPIKSRR